MSAVLVKNADRMMTSAELLVEGIEIAFADGCRGLVPLAEIPEVEEGDNFDSVDLPNPYEFVLRTSTGETIEFPWDFVRHFCDASYRPKVETVALVSRLAIGLRIRQMRGSAGLTQDSLAKAADIGRVTLVRIEKGGQSPRYETLVSLAQAFGRSMRELVGGGEDSE
jgi:DNA-binding XRE family transcriptional regulator|tara:strand:+ start:59 stop:559 length:501 start_codon:yes stop_codon:yes gene_type:complete